MKTLTKTLLTATLILGLPLGAYAASEAVATTQAGAMTNCPMDGSGRRAARPASRRAARHGVPARPSHRPSRSAESGSHGRPRGWRSGDSRAPAAPEYAQAGSCAMHPCKGGGQIADMMRDEPDDALAVGGAQRVSAIFDPLPQPVDPEPTVGIEHDLDDLAVGEPRRDRAAHRRA